MTTKSETGKQTDIQIEGLADRQTNKQTGRPTDRQGDRQTNRQTGRQRNVGQTEVIASRYKKFMGSTRSSIKCKESFKESSLFAAQ